MVKQSKLVCYKCGSRLKLLWIGRLRRVKEATEYKPRADARGRRKKEMQAQEAGEQRITKTMALSRA
jgi:hypothetical protein